MFGSWLKGFSSKLRIQIIVGVPTLHWANLLSWNDVDFIDLLITLSCRLFSGNLLDQSWIVAVKEEKRDALQRGCGMLETTVMELFTISTRSLVIRLRLAFIHSCFVSKSIMWYFVV